MHENVSSSIETKANWLNSKLNQPKIKKIFKECNDNQVNMWFQLGAMKEATSKHWIEIRGTTLEKLLHNL